MSSASGRKEVVAVAVGLEAVVRWCPDLTPLPNKPWPHAASKRLGVRQRGCFCDSQLRLPSVSRSSRSKVSGEREWGGWIGKGGREGGDVNSTANPAEMSHLASH